MKCKIVIPGSKISEWFSHQGMGVEVNIKQHSHLYNECMGIAVCVVFCFNYVTHQLYFTLTASGKVRVHLVNCNRHCNVITIHL